MVIFSAIITGFGLGSMYGLLALGFYVTYSVSNTVNFAQGSAMMLGAVLAFTFSVTFGWPVWSAVMLSLLLCAAWGVIVERVGVRPFVKRGSDAWLMATVAIGIILENAVLFTFGKDPRGMPPSLLTSEGFHIADLRIQALQVVIPVVGGWPSTGTQRSLLVSTRARRRGTDEGVVSRPCGHCRTRLECHQERRVEFSCHA